MSERKVLNKYYPKDYDPSKIPKNRQEKNRQWNIRIMAPFNMRCNTCGEYIYKGKKFNSRKEDVEDETYLGLKIFRFYIRCPRCVAEIAFRTDPENTDYSLEAGATRNFEALRTAEMLAEKERQAKEEEDKNNPMKVLENRTKASQREMEMLETLEELRELNSRQAIIDHEKMIKLHAAYEEQLGKLQDEEDEAFIKSLFGKKGEESVKRLKDDEDDDDDDKEKKNGDNKTDEPPTKKLATGLPPTSVLTEEKSASAGIRKTAQKPQVWEKSIGSLSNKNSLKMLVKKKPLVNPTSDTKSQPAVHPTSNPEVEGNSNSDEDRCKPENHSTSTGLRNNTNSDTAPKATSAAPAKTGALGLLGNYSDSDASSEGDNE